MRLVAFQATGAVQIQLQGLRASRWFGALSRSANPAPDARDELPTAPVSVVARGTQRGQQIVVVALSPLFASNGEPQRASSVDAQISGVVPLDTTTSNPFVTQPGRPEFKSNAVTVPSGYAPAQQQAVTIRVHRAGLQQVSGAGLPAFPFSQLRLLRGTAEVPLEIDDADANGVLSAADQLRFFAVSPGDR